MAAEKITNDYDDVPYVSYPYPNTQPEHLYAIAKLFDVNAVSPKKAKVLELGCASGGNIIPMAIKYPNSEFVGVDYSSVQIEEANKHKNKLELKNLKFQDISIADIDKKFGKFDYIIVHGILSWVPKDIQQKIFEVCSNNLTDNGVAYISYNTLPGWGIVRSIREMMLYHTGRFSSPVDKVTEARKLLNFIKSGNGVNSDNAYSKFIQDEIDTLSGTSDSYLIHDHLEENNEPFYFHEFMKIANENNLQYLSDAMISTMFIGNFPKDIAEILKKVGNDIVRTEQYMDFIRNRRFRSSLLCKQGIKINRTINGNKLKDFYLSTSAKPEVDIKDIDISSNNVIKFKGVMGNEFKVTDKYLVTALLYMSQENKAVKASDVIIEVGNRLGSLAKKGEFEQQLLNKLLVLLFSNNIDILAFEPTYVTSVSDKPKASGLVKYQATYTDWVTNELSNRVGVDVFSRVIIRYLNGKNNFEDIAAKMKEHIAKGELVVSEEGNKITDANKIDKKVRELIKLSLEKMANSKVLIA